MKYGTRLMELQSKMRSNKKVILVSACLLGINTKYNAGNNYNRDVLALGTQFSLVPVCPEQLGGLTTPRAAAEISGGTGEDVLLGTAQVYTASGDDTTEAFLRGAQETLQMAKIFSAQGALLKARSPSCGCGEVYDGSFCSVSQKGDGVTTALLKREGITVFTEEDLVTIQDF